MSISTSPTARAAQHLRARCSRQSHSACRHCSVLHIEHSLGPCQKSFLSQKSHVRTSRTGRSASLTCGPTPVTAKYLTYSCHQDFLHTPICHTHSAQQSDSSGSVKCLVGLLQDWHLSALCIFFPLFNCFCAWQTRQENSHVNALLKHTAFPQTHQGSVLLLTYQA